MNPAFSVVFLTTLIGAGQGLFLALFLGQLYGTFLVGSETPPLALYSVGTAWVVALMGLGLFASFFHLGRPERAWRAATMWRTSWLAREVIVLPAFSAMALVWGAMHYLAIDPVLATLGNVRIPLSLLVGIAAVALALLLFVCTGMIYAAIKFIQEWASPLTVWNYFALGTASGFTLASALAAQYAPHLLGLFALLAIVLTLVGYVTRMYALRRNARLKRKTTPMSAIGVRHPRITQISQGAMGGSFNTREFFHHKSAEVVQMIKVAFPIAGFIVPIALTVIGWGNSSVVLLGMAFAVQYIGLLLERWFFFAQAWHPQNIYYVAT